MTRGAGRGTGVWPPLCRSCCRSQARQGPRRTSGAPLGRAPGGGAVASLRAATRWGTPGGKEIRSMRRWTRKEDEVVEEEEEG